MNKKTLLLITSVSALVGSVASCSLGGDPYFKVDFYSDYENIHNGAQGEDYTYEDGLSTSKAVYIGSGYVSQKGSSKVARLSHLNKQSDGTVFDYHVTRQIKQKGYNYNFDGWQGFYEASSGTGEKVDLQNITGNCAVFAHFAVEKEAYVVSIQNVDSSLIYQKELEYGTKLGDALAEEFGSLDAAKKKLSEVEYTLPSPYYLEHSFTGNYVDSDGGSLSVDDLLELEIEGKKTFKASFSDEMLSSYKVSFFTDSTLKDALSVDEVTFTNITYGDSLTATLPDYEEDGYVYTFSGWNGTYDETAPDLIKGKSFDSKHVLWNCSVYPNYEKKIKQVNVSLLNGDGSVNSTTKVDYGTQFSELNAPSNIIGVPSGYSFSSYWSEEENDSDASNWISPSFEIKEDVTFYPVYAKTKIENVSGDKGDLFTFDFDLSKKGYVISSFSPSSSRSDTQLNSEDIPVNELPTGFTLIGVESLKDSSNSYRTALESIILPESIKYIGSRAFAYHTKVTSLSMPGVVEIDAFGLAGLFSLSSISLPSSLLKVGSKAFYEDSNLTEIKLDLTSDMPTSLLWASDWNSNGETLVPVIYATK